MQWLHRLRKRPSTGEMTVETQAPRLYLDHAATTPLEPTARLAMLPYLDTLYGNASAIHSEGRVMRHAIEQARVDVARVLGIQPAGVLFTSGGTEGNNLAIRGVVAAGLKAGRAYEDMEIISTAIEHPATARTLEHLATLGVRIKTVPVDTLGRIILPELSALVTDKTVLVAVSYVNSEIGTVERIGQLKRLITEKNSTTLLYVDAAQAPLWLPCELSRLKADIMTFDGTKCGGPTGVGVVACRKGVVLSPVTFGGGQERGLRPGTEPAAQIVGMSVALHVAQYQFAKRAERISHLRDEAIKQLEVILPQVVLNGARGEARVANNINISLPGLDSEYAVVLFDTHGIAVSTKSACSSAGGGQSVVVFAVTGDPARAASTLRITLGPDTTAADIDRLVTVLTTHVLPLALRQG